MGDPKFSRTKYDKPNHPWKGERIKREDEYVRKFGLKNKREFWKAESFLRTQRGRARELLPLVLRQDPQAVREADQLLKRLNRLGLLEDNASLDDVLALSVDAVLSRRLQTVAFVRGLATTPNQARQLIIHGHIAVGGRRMSAPGYLVPRVEEQDVAWTGNSPLQNEAHPIRQVGVIRAHPTNGDEPSEDEAAAAAEAERHRALKMAEEAEAEEKVDVLDAEPDEAEAPAEPETADEPAEAEEKGGDEQ